MSVDRKGKVKTRRQIQAQKLVSACVSGECVCLCRRKSEGQVILYSGNQMAGSPRNGERERQESLVRKERQIHWKRRMGRGGACQGDWESCLTHRHTHTHILLVVNVSGGEECVCVFWIPDSDHSLMQRRRRRHEDNLIVVPNTQEGDFQWTGKCFSP